MATKPNPKAVTSPKQPKGNDENGKFVPHNLLGTNPTKEQFAPTEAEPVRQRFKMGGGC